MVHIAVLMTCHNRKEKTLQCLRALSLQVGLNQDYSIKVHLVDDGSTDGTSLALKHFYPDVQVLSGDGNLYWNRGMYTAWAAATKGSFDFYLWLNDDTNLYSNALCELLSAAKITGFKSIICGSIESTTKKGMVSYGGGNLIGNKYIENYPDGNLKQCDIINGNCVLIPQFVFEKVGNLDWQFIHAIGDNDYSLRAKKQGISSFSTGKFIASCAQHDTLPKWCLPQVNILDRIKNLYSPLGYSHPYYQFIYEKRHFGIATAIKHFFSINLRVLIPSLWK